MLRAIGAGSIYVTTLRSDLATEIAVDPHVGLRNGQMRFCTGSGSRLVYAPECGPEHESAESCIAMRRDGLGRLGTVPRMQRHESHDAQIVLLSFRGVPSLHSTLRRRLQRRRTHTRISGPTCVCYSRSAIHVSDNHPIYSRSSTRSGFGCQVSDTASGNAQVSMDLTSAYTMHPGWLTIAPRMLDGRNRRIGGGGATRGSRDKRRYTVDINSAKISNPNGWGPAL